MAETFDVNKQQPESSVIVRTETKTETRQEQEYRLRREAEDARHEREEARKQAEHEREEAQKKAEHERKAERVVLYFVVVLASMVGIVCLRIAFFNDTSPLANWAAGILSSMMSGGVGYLVGKASDNMAK